MLGTRPTSAADALSQIDRVLDRSHLMPPGAVESVMKGMKAGNHSSPERRRRSMAGGERMIVSVILVPLLFPF